MGRLGTHPHVVTVFDKGEQDGQPYIVTELMGGGDVEGVIEDSDHDHLPLEQALEIAKATSGKVLRGVGDRAPGAHVSPRIHQHGHRQEQLEAAHEEIQDRIKGRKQEVVDIKTVTKYAAELRELLAKGSIVDRRSFVRSFVKEIRVGKEEAKIKYTIPMPPEDTSEEEASVLPIVQFGGPAWTRTRDLSLIRTAL